MQAKDTYEDIWDELAQKLPWKNTPEDRAKRDKIWGYFDVNKNGLVSLAEADKAIRDGLKLPILFNLKPVLMRAFNQAKNKSKSKNKIEDDFVSRSEFRFLLMYLR